MSTGDEKMSFLVHTLEYKGSPVIETLSLRNYDSSDYEKYKNIYEDCFFAMRSALGLPRECCKSSEELASLKDSIFIFEDNGSIIGSVAVYGNEIDDLFVSSEYQRKGCGLKLLRYAIAYLQKRKTERIILHAADINQSALMLYLKNGFVITETKVIKTS